MSKYIIEQEVDEVKFKKVHLNVEEYGDGLVELTDEELDQRLKEYSQQGLYVSTYYQHQTKRHGIEFRRFIFSLGLDSYKFYNNKPWHIPDDEPLSGEKCYYIKPYLVDVEVCVLGFYDSTFCKRYIQYLTEREFADIVKEYLKRGMQVNIGEYKRKKKKLEFIRYKTVQEVKDNGKIIYIW